MYQVRRVPFANKENYISKRRSRAEEETKKRRLSRQAGFDSNRNIAPDIVLTVTHEIKEEHAEPKVISRSEQLKKWKQEKEAMKKAEREKKAKEKPPFKCGRVHHEPPPVLGSECRRSARIKNQSTLIVDKVAPVKPEISLRKKKEKQSFSSHKSLLSFAPVSHRFKAPDNLPKIVENSVSYDGDATGWNADFSMVFPAQLSPWISKGRGSDGGKASSLDPMVLPETPVSVKKTKSAGLSKGTPDNLRILVGKKLVEQSMKTPELQEKIVEKKSPKSTTPVLSEVDASSLQNFRSLYNGEMNRLDGLCSQWDLELLCTTCHEIPVDVKDIIRTTVGQTRLLMREKLAQFKDLLQQFQEKTSKTSPVITTSDLQGFWDLVSIQVTDVDAKFSSLDTLKRNNWIQEEEEPKAKATTGVFRRRNVANTFVKVKKTAGGKSSFKAYIAEQRRKIEEAKEKVPLTLNEGSVKKSKRSLNTSQINTSSIGTPTPILRRRSSVRRQFEGQGLSATPRSARRVTFAADCIGNDRPSVVVVKSPYIAATAAGDDLISWESPLKDVLNVGARRSPRLSGNIKK